MEEIVELVRMSMQDPSTFTVLLTGRADGIFDNLITRMVDSKGLTFDMICLKPKVSPPGEVIRNTMEFKQSLLRDIMLTYTDAEAIKVYEDRPKHTQNFRTFFEQFNQSLQTSPNPPRMPIAAEVVQVPELDTQMDPTSEIAEVQRMINVHNTAVVSKTAPPRSIPYKMKDTIFWTGYVIPQDVSETIKTFIPQDRATSDLHYSANCIMIFPGPARNSTIKTVGGMHAKMSWRVTGLGSLSGDRLFAARVEPAIPGTPYYSINKTPHVLLASRPGVKAVEAKDITNWTPVAPEQALEFETTVGQRMLLRIEEEIPGEDAFEAQQVPREKMARKHGRDEDFPPLGSGPRVFNSGSNGNNFRGGGGRGGGYRGNGGGNQGFGGQRGGNNYRGNSGGGPRGGGGRGGGYGGRGRGGGRGGGGGMGAGGRGRGAYKSLDSNPGQGYGSGGMDY